MFSPMPPKFPFHQCPTTKMLLILNSSKTVVNSASKEDIQKCFFCHLCRIIKPAREWTNQDGGRVTAVQVRFNVFLILSQELPKTGLLQKRDTHHNTWFCIIKSLTVSEHFLLVCVFLEIMLELHMQMSWLLHVYI